MEIVETSCYPVNSFMYYGKIREQLLLQAALTGPKSKQEVTASLANAKGASLQFYQSCIMYRIKRTIKMAAKAFLSVKLPPGRSAM